MTRLGVMHCDQTKTCLTGANLAALVSVKLSKTWEPVRGVFTFCYHTDLRYSDVAALLAGNLHLLGANGDRNRFALHPAAADGHGAVARAHGRRGSKGSN